MSLPIWTPDALSCECGPFDGLCWRLVEAQHRVSTLPLVDDLDEQAMLEQILEETKPPIPPEYAHLDYLLSTPFRYAPYPHGSRFRRAGMTPGVYYAAERVETALAETAFYRYLFHSESPGTPWPRSAAEFTALGVALRSDDVLDLTVPPLSRDVAQWTQLTDYTACQALTDTARAAGVQVIRFQSVRDPGQGANLAVLTCASFGEPAPSQHQTWRLRIGPMGAQALCGHPTQRVEFSLVGFLKDSRLQSLV